MASTAQPPPPHQPQPQPRTPSPSPSQSAQHLRLQVEVTVISAKHLKNINWKQGNLKPYAVVYLDPDCRVATKPDETGSTKPVWNERFVLPVPTRSLEDAVLGIEIFHSKPSETPKSAFVGLARSPLKDLLPSKEKQPLNDQYYHQGDLSPQPLPVIRTLELRRSSGRPQGKVRIKVSPIMELPPVYTSSSTPPLPDAATTATTHSVPPPPPEDYRRLSSASPNSSAYYNTSYPDYATVARPPPVAPEEDYRNYSSPPAPPLPNHYGTSTLPPPQMVPQSRLPYTATGSFSDAPPYPFGTGYSCPSFAGSGYYSAPPAPPRMLQQNTPQPPLSSHGSSVSTRDFPSSSGPSAPLDYYAASTAPHQYRQHRERVTCSSSVGTGVDMGVSNVAGSFHDLTLEEGTTFSRNYEDGRIVDNNRDTVARTGYYRDFRAGF